MNKYDVAVIGSGPGGYAAAVRSAQRGMRTVLIEKEDLGGICLNWGCIPTKAIIRSVNALRDMKQAEELGIDVKEAKADVPRIIARSRKISGQLTKGIAYLMKKHEIPVVEGHARLLKNGGIEIEKNDGEKEVLEAEHIILATGSRPKALPHIPIDGKKVISSRHALELEKLPATMAIIGGGAIGVEFAYIYKHLGVDVTVIEALDALLPNEDEEISRELLKQFKKQKIGAMTGSKVIKFEKADPGLMLTIESSKGEQTLEVEQVLSAVGVKPNTEDLGLEERGIDLEKGFIKVDGHQLTNIPGIYAIGDVAGNPCLAHKASKEALIAIDHIQDKKVKPLNRDHIPACTYCEPQVASVGLSERDAAEQKKNYKVSKVLYRAIGKALASGHIDGFLKCIVDEKTGKVLGAHCIGAEATELIAELTLAVTKGLTMRDLADTIHAHPTFSELILETAENSEGEAIHV